MLTISKPLSASQALTYHAKEFTSAEQNYWKQDDRTLGEWHGKLADKFGVAGGVQEEHFARLADGQHPVTAERLVIHRSVQEYTGTDGKSVTPVEHRAGWDATFSAPKSISLTALVGGDDRVREAHREAVNVALNELERYTQARIGGNRPAETTGEFIAAKFEHDTARPVDGYAAPQLHTHAVIFNVTERTDGSTRALQPQGLFDTQQFATAVYQSELTYRLRGLGYDIVPGRSGAPEIKGYSQEYLDASSPRSQQIRDHLERTGYQGPEAAQIAAHSTRDKKEIHSPAEVLEAHRQIAAEFGNQAESVVTEARARAQEQTTEHNPESSQQVARQAITYARDRSFEREAVTDERDLYRDALRRGMSETTYSEVRTGFEARIAAGEFQLVRGQKHDSGRSFTTAETIRAEKEILRQMREGQGRAQQIMSIQSAVAHTEKQQHLNAGQRSAAEEILTSRDFVQGMEGRAGVGKTTLLKSVREAAEKRGYVVEGFAPTSRAANQLHDAGISADTLQGFLARAKLPSPDRHLYMVDESSLASTKQVRDFLAKVDSGDRVLLIGDTRQHQGVEAGKPFEQLVNAGMKTTQLDQIVRQRAAPELLKAVEHLSRGEIAEGISLLEQQGRVTEIADAQQRIAAIARSYAANPDNTIVVSPDNTSRRQINQAVRSALQALGTIASEDHTMSVLAPRSDMTGADRTWAARYAVDDILYYSCGSQAIGIEKQSYTKVIAAQPKGNLLTVQKTDGTTVTYNPARLHGVNVYRELDREFAIGDRVGFTAPSKELGIANRDLGTAQRINQNGQFTVRMDNGKLVSFDVNQMRHFDHGYAVTSHSAQGLTADRVIVNVDTEVHSELISSRFAYVSVSRASHDAQVFTNNAETLIDRLSHDVTKSSAIAVSNIMNANAGIGVESHSSPKTGFSTDPGLAL
jgi:conjugative relaxase-like TrwC/TraI family protein